MRVKTAERVVSSAQAHTHTHTHAHARSQTHTHTQTHAVTNRGSCILQFDFARADKNTVIVSALEVNVATHSAVVLADGLIQLHATAWDVLHFVIAKEPQHTATRVPVHMHALAHVSGRNVCLSNMKYKGEG